MGRGCSRGSFRFSTLIAARAHDATDARSRQHPRRCRRRSAKGLRSLFVFQDCRPATVQKINETSCRQPNTTARLAHRRELVLRSRKGLYRKIGDAMRGLNIGFTKDGLTEIIGAGRPRLDPAFEKGAGNRETIEKLHDPPSSDWLKEFVSDRIDGILLITGPSRSVVRLYQKDLLRFLGASIKVVYSEIGNTRPGAQRGFEHFGYRDGISQPGIRGLTRRSRPAANPALGLPGQDLIWPGEFVFGYPGQD